MLRDVAVHRGIGRPREADAGVDPPPGLVRIRSCHHAESDLAGAQRRHAGGTLQFDATRRQDRGHRHQVLLLDIGFAKGQLEGRQPLAMDADAAGQEEMGGNGKHFCTSMGPGPSGYQCRRPDRGSGGSAN
jgi:hypothetical protein